MFKNKNIINFKSFKKDAGRDARVIDGEKRIVSVLDIGSSKICCFIAEVKTHGTIEVIGIGHQASKGVKSGTIIDLRAAEMAVAHAVEAAELMAKDHIDNHPIKSVYVNISDINTLSHQTAVDVKVSGHAVTDRDVKIALNHSKSVVTHGKDELIHIIPVEYSIDRTRGILEPRGMVGENLGVNLVAVTATTSSLCHLAAIIGQNQLELDGFCGGSYAASLATLTDDEMQLGCTVIDMGGGTTSISAFYGGKLIYTSAIPIGGINVTNDIARGLTTSIADAERIKTLYGSAHSTATDDSSMIDVPPIGEEEQSQANYVPRSLLTGIIQPRIEETFELVREKLEQSGVNNLVGRRVVLTGGASQLPGLTEVAKLILDKQIRIGKPQGVKGLAEATEGPAFASAAGTLIYAVEHANEIPDGSTSYNFNLPIEISGQFMQKVTRWLKDNW